MDPEASINELAARIDRLESELSGRVAELERLVSARRDAEVAGATAAVPGAEPTPPAIQTETPASPPPPVADWRTAPPPPPPSMPAPLPPKARPSWISSLQVEDVLRIVGVVLVGLAAVFLVSTAITRGWIGPELQLLGATLIGVFLLGSALRLADKQPVWATTLGVGGSAVLAVCAGAAYAWLDLTGPVQALILVAVAAAVSVVVAMRIRSEAVAIAATAAMLIVPPFSNIVADSPVLVIGVWLGLFAVVAMVLGVAQRWPTYRLLSTWATAFWVIVLAAVLAADDNTDHLIAGACLVAVVGVVLWLGPMLNEGLLTVSSAAGLGVTDGQGRLLALEHRMVAIIPLWAWQTVVLLGGLDVPTEGAGLALVMAAGFVAVATVIHRADRISEVGFVSHLLGAGLLITVGLLVWLQGPVLVVALAAQAVTILVIAYYFDDLFLKINGIVLTGIVWLLLVIDLVDVVQAALDDVGGETVGSHLARAVALLLLAGSAALVARNNSDDLAELVAGIVWPAVLLFPVSLVAPVVDERRWLVVGAVAALVSLAAARVLGRVVLAIGAAIGGATLMATAIGLIEVTVARLDGDRIPVADHLSHLAAVVAIGLVTAAVWSRRPKTLAPPLFVLSWVYSLAWLASVLIGVPQAQVAISAVWALAAAGAIVAGLLSGRTVVRYVGLTTLGVVLVKLLTVDLAEVETLWRVGLFLVIGLGLLRLGYVLPDLAARYTKPEDGPDGPSGDTPGGPTVDPANGSVNGLFEDAMDEPNGPVTDQAGSPG